MSWVVRDSERASFKSCRLAWDFGARTRQNLVPSQPAEADRVAAAFRATLAVHYFPGMWSWQRAVVEPLALAALRRETADDEEARRTAEAAFASYLDFAAPLDRFTSIRVAHEFQVNVPDPFRSDRDLVAADGEPVRYVGSIDLLVEGRAAEYWLVEHRFAPAGFAAEQDLRLDEESAAHCWAWESFFLGMKIHGTIFNEISISPGRDRGVSFRRTTVRRSAEELAAHRRRFALEVQDMLDPGLRIYPSPTPSLCAPCAYRRPCRALNEGGDARPFLVAEFRPRETDIVVEPRIGAGTWSQSRGAAIALGKGYS